MPQPIHVKIPDLDLGTTELRVSVWHAKVGQRLNFGDRLLELWAGDVIIDIPAPADGTLRKLLIAEDEIVGAGQAVATIMPDG